MELLVHWVCCNGSSIAEGTDDFDNAWAVAQKLVSEGYTDISVQTYAHSEIFDWRQTAERFA